MVLPASTFACFWMFPECSGQGEERRKGQGRWVLWAVWYIVYANLGLDKKRRKVLPWRLLCALFVEWNGKCHTCECLSWEQHTIETVLLKHWAGVLGMFPVDARSVQSSSCRGQVSLPRSTDLLEIMHVVNWLFLFVSTQIQYLAFISVPNSKWDH